MASPLPSRPSGEWLGSGPSLTPEMTAQPTLLAKGQRRKRRQSKRKICVLLSQIATGGWGWRRGSGKPSPGGQGGWDAAPTSVWAGRGLIQAVGAACPSLASHPIAPSEAQFGGF